MVERAEIVAAARRYVGTPFRHQGRHREFGIDCRGLVSCVAYDLGLMDVRIDDYDRQPNETRFRAEVRKHMDPIPFSQLLPGDALTFFFGAERHFGLVTKIDPLTIVHAYEAVGRCVEQAVDQTISLRIRGCYRYRGVV